ncbi:flagellar basal body P-ring formation protein FlgA [Ponticoccus sp. SC2-23]|uniref:flagellar basal body P-ring formation chaperone FlgA n=1 Tax=Alexandriicola marinus TaxID=2081710 RepID=UPI000FDA0186|nr:flagellar basal body P-ring formation chaperone FlgA [Alexandriicola marinus]MBM1220513.1 flagellar basal body P-ring formation protein FlgA [Ponticoccus sp. SC6-9]MBM1225199.1 flagellar basal body P-ring formation protein FlgA [Ponticoccus sp. SC6-15]MBM1228713.1 flagellar basal body P-ring formation protein FlgA [Ponticoccus sp. SC6-38]MBM1233650.1 flagellar basal body P-ring formation protein FlgA [Ponticoccus sp. SC6-45]MBM1239214.1 flagellar basal body P-ring formation protein FlgA [Po
MIRIVALTLIAGSASQAETVVAARTIPAQSLIMETDLAIIDQTVPGAIADPAIVIGQEARIALYAGRPIRTGDIAAPAVVDRNDIIPLVYQGGALMISTEGRALERAGAGEFIRVMNISSRNTVTARVAQDGTAYVSAQ